jgi:uncharacterized protein (TIGR02271 family)
MPQSQHRRVIGKGGLRGTIESIGHHGRDGEPLARLRLDDGQSALVPLRMLEARGDGSYATTLSPADLHAQPAPPGEAEPPIVVPVIEEHLAVEKRTVETGRVRVRKLMHERQETIDEPLLRQEAAIERRPINQVVDAPLPARYEGETLVIPVLEEVLVVEKQLVLKEEIRITPRRTEEHRPQQVTLRGEQVVVERVEPGERQSGGDGERA